ncbi:MAG: undecaprenyl-diphosphatase [Candidatus Marinamargulisbacteria bacterium]|jgi:undecaprenyl-diphosphatase
MSDYLRILFLSLVEGLTEFIPVSSTAHLILAESWVKLSMENMATFQISIQLGAIGAVVWLYRDYFTPFFNPKYWLSKQSKVLIIAICPVLIAGFLAYPFIKSLFSPEKVAIALLIGGIVMIVVEKWGRLKPTTFAVEDITPKQALGVGIAQCFALWPGTSRSGASIVGGLICKLDYPTAAKFSFLISVPVMLAAVGYDLLKNAQQISVHEFKYILIGMGLSFIFAVFSISTFLKLLKRFRLAPFAIYRIVLSLFIIYS